jgi:hypothetical protein
VRFKLSNPVAGSTYDFYLNSYDEVIEEQVNRLGPHEFIAAAFDWPKKTYDYRGWTDTINSLWWPHDGDDFASCIVLIDDTQAAAVEASCLLQTGAESASISAQPYLIMSAMLAPAVGADSGDAYAPSGASVPTTETALIEWKLYPLVPVKLSEVDATDTFSGLWMLPLVDLRYFWRSGPLVSRTGGSTTSAPTTDFHILAIDHDVQAPWMPDLLAYPNDLAAPTNYVAITGNGTHPSIDAIRNKGVCADIQAQMEGWRIVNRDVRSGYNAPHGDNQHSSFTGIISDYPDGNDTQSFTHAATVVTNGSGYVTGDEVQVSGGTFEFAATFLVTARDGHVTSVEWHKEGEYTATPSNPASTVAVTGAGAGLTLTVTWESRAKNSYHQDAIRLAQWQTEDADGNTVSNLVAGGLLDDEDRDYLTPHKLQIHFQCTGSGDEGSYYTLVTFRSNTAGWPASVANISEDTTGLGTGERTYVPRLFLGVDVESTSPGSTEVAALLTAAKQRSFLYWQWRKKPAFFKYPGIAPVIPNGYAHMIRWDFSKAKCETLYLAIDGVGEEDDFGGSGGSTALMMPIKITGEGTGDLKGYYAFTEQMRDTTKSGSVWTDKTPSPRTGTVLGVAGAASTNNPAKDDSDKVAVPIGQVVFAKPGKPYVDVNTGLTFDDWRFTTPDDLQVVRVIPNGDRNTRGEVQGYILRYDPTSGEMMDWDTIWIKLL